MASAAPRGDLNRWRAAANRHASHAPAPGRPQLLDRQQQRCAFIRKRLLVETRGKKDDTLGEEVSALGQRAKGAAKDVVGDVIDDEEMEAEGKVENAVGRA